MVVFHNLWCTAWITADVFLMKRWFALAALAEDSTTHKIDDMIDLLNWQE